MLTLPLHPCFGRQPRLRSQINSWFCNLPEDIILQALMLLGELKDLVRLDSATCNQRYRWVFLRTLSSLNISHFFRDHVLQHIDALKWLRLRQIHPERLVICAELLSKKKGVNRICSLRLDKLNGLQIASGVDNLLRKCELDAAIWRKVILCCNHLQYLDISTYIVHLENIFHALSQPLKSLRLRYQRLALDVIAPLETLGHCMEELHISQCSISDACLLKLLTYCPYLTRLSVDDCTGMSAQSLSSMLLYLPRLEHLHFSLPRGYTENLASLDWSILPEHLPLKSLDLPLSGLAYDQLVHLLSLAHSLQEIHTFSLSFHQEASIQALSIMDGRILVREQLQMILQRFGDKASALAAADLSQDQVCSLLQHTQNLQSIDFIRCAVSDESIDLLGAHNPHLKSLRLHACTGLTDHHLALLSRRCPEIIQCRIPGNVMIGDGALKSLHQWSELRHLDVCRCPVGDRGVSAVLEGCPKLEQCLAFHTRVSPSLQAVLEQRRLSLFAPSSKGVNA